MAAVITVFGYCSIDIFYYPAGSYFAEKDYTKALEYYKKALEYSDHNEYKYELYYWIATCHYYLKDYETAKELHKKFLDNNWEPDRLPKEVAYAKEYIKYEVLNR